MQKPCVQSSGIDAKPWARAHPSSRKASKTLNPTRSSTRTDKALQFCQINAGPQVFRWIAFVCPFLDRLQHLHSLHNFTYWACTTDFTTRVCHLEYQVGFISAIAFKQQRNTWLKGALPLLALCAPQECKEIYRPGHSHSMLKEAPS